MSPNLSNQSLTNLNTVFSFRPFEEIIRPFCLNRFLNIEDEIKAIEKNNHKLTVVIGDEGSGKTCLSFHLTSSNKTHAYRVVCSNGTKIANIAKFCFNQINIPPFQNTDSPSDLLLKLCDYLKENNRPLHLVLDQADKLPLETLAGILHVQNNCSGDLKFVLIGNSTLEKKLTQITKSEQAPTHTVFTIKPLNFVQTRSFIQDSIYNASNGQFTKACPWWIVYKVYRLSKGNPRKINEYCTTDVMHFLDKHHQSPQKTNNSLWLIVTLLVITGAIAFQANLFQKDDTLTVTSLESTPVVHDHQQEILASNSSDTITIIDSVAPVVEAISIDTQLIQPPVNQTAIDLSITHLQDDINQSKAIEQADQAPLAIEFPEKINNALYTIRLVNATDTSMLKRLYSSLKEKGFPVSIHPSEQDQSQAFSLNLGIYTKPADAKHLIKKLGLNDAEIIQIQ